ncbi:hypothetical protein MHBO_003948, partial [Bonamia ostreae]
KKKFESHKFAITILKAPLKTQILTIQNFHSLLKWLLFICKGCDQLKSFVQKSLSQPLKLHQKLRISPLTRLERKLQIENQFKSDLRAVTEYFRPFYDKINNFVTAVAPFDEDFEKKAERFLLNEINAKKVNDYFIMRTTKTGEKIYAKIFSDTIKWCSHIPIQYKSLLYDENEIDFENSVLKTKKNLPKTSKLDLWIDYHFMIIGSKDLQRLYNDLTFQLITGNQFKVFWGRRFMKLYSKIISKYNHSIVS